MIKAVFFDFDGVLALPVTGSFQISTYISEKTGLPQNTIYEIFMRIMRPLDSSIGKISDHWDEFCKEIGHEVDFGLIQEAFEALPKNDGMFEIVKSVKKNYKTGIITDNIKERFDYYKEAWKLSELFEVMVCSAEVGCTKRATKIFNIALEEMGISPEEAIFIDNSIPNCEMAKKAGMKAIFHDDNENDLGKLKSQLEKSFKNFI